LKVAPSVVWREVSPTFLHRKGHIRATKERDNPGPCQEQFADCVHRGEAQRLRRPRAVPTLRGRLWLHGAAEASLLGPPLRRRLRLLSGHVGVDGHAAARRHAASASSESRARPAVSSLCPAAAAPDRSHRVQHAQGDDARDAGSPRRAASRRGLRHRAQRRALAADPGHGRHGGSLRRVPSGASTPTIPRTSRTTR
jgi:hypothetical protein